MTSTAGAPFRGYRQNLDALRAAQKPSRGTAAYSRLVNRPLGRRVAAAAHTIGITPNQATAVSATLSGAGLLLLATAPPGWQLALAVPVLLAAGYVMDSVDGQLARLRGRGSKSGEWLDHTVDCFKACVLHLAVLISWFRFPPVDNDAVLLIPVVYEIVDMVTFFSLILVTSMRPATSGRGADVGHAEEHPLRKWFILPTDYGFFCWVFVLLAWPTAFLAGYSAMALANGVVLVLALRKWWRELRLIDLQERELEHV